MRSGCFRERSIAGVTGFVFFPFPSGDDGIFDVVIGDDTVAGRRYVRFDGRYDYGGLVGRNGDHAGVYSRVVRDIF